MVLAGLSNGALASGDTRVISLFNDHTEETLEIGYKEDGLYILDAMAQIDHIMRDWRRDEAIEMAPELVNLIRSFTINSAPKNPSA